MRTHIVAVAALAGSMLLAPTVMQQAKAGHGGGFGGGMGGAHFGGGMSGAHFSGGVGGPHFAGGHMAGAHGGENWHGGQFASRDGGWQGGRHVAWNRATVLGMATIGMTTIISSKTTISTIASTTVSLQSDSAGRATIAMDMDTVAAGGCGIRL